jgi:hypothetical protein
MGEPLWIEIIAYAPTAYYHCMHCEVAWREIGVDNRIHDEQVSSSLPVELLHEYQSISDWVNEIFQRHGNLLIVKVIDAASPEGLLKSLRYRLKHYPSIIVDHQAQYTGEKLLEAGKEIDRRLLTKQPVEG